MTAQLLDLEVLVTFAAASRPYRHRYPATATAGHVLSDALIAFGVASDGTTRYYLLFGGTEVASTQTLAELVGTHSHGHEVKLSLRTETISGAR